MSASCWKLATNFLNLSSIIVKTPHIVLPIIVSTRRILSKVINLEILTEIVHKLSLTGINKYLFILYARFYIFFFLVLFLVLSFLLITNVIRDENQFPVMCSCEKIK